MSPHAQAVQRFPDGDPGAEQRSGSGRIQTGGKRVGEPVADDLRMADRASAPSSMLCRAAAARVVR
jgi:hypothetical protein